MPKLKKIVQEKHDTAMAVEGSSCAPQFYVDDKQMPEMKSWEVGEKYQLIIEVEQKSRNENEYGVNGTFSIVGYKHMPKKTVDEMTDEEFEIEQGKALSRK